MKRIYTHSISFEITLFNIFDLSHLFQFPTAWIVAGLISILIKLMTLFAMALVFCMQQLGTTFSYQILATWKDLSLVVYFVSDLSISLSLSIKWTKSCLTIALERLIEVTEEIQSIDNMKNIQVEIHDHRASLDSSRSFNLLSIVSTFMSQASNIQIFLTINEPEKYEQIIDKDDIFFINKIMQIFWLVILFDACQQIQIFTVWPESSHHISIVKTRQCTEKHFH